MLKYILAWIPMLFIAIFNGAVREMWLVEYFGELRAHQLSCVTGIVLLGAFIWAVIRNWRPACAGAAVTIGLIWLIMTIAFEFLFGFYVYRGVLASGFCHRHICRSTVGACFGLGNHRTLSVLCFAEWAKNGAAERPGK